MSTSPGPTDPNTPDRAESRAPGTGWRERLQIIIFQSDTRAGRLFDIVLLGAIVLSVLVVMLESVPSLVRFREAFRLLEWGFTILFSIEYVLRLVSAPSAGRYARSFYGVVDILSLLPTYLATLEGAHSLLVIRSLRLLRVFRILRLGEFLHEASMLTEAMRRSARKILLFVGSVLVLVNIMGAVMYLVEGPEHGFTSIPISVYWAVVTLTTVGYGDIAPQTALGQALSVLVMLAGYAIIAVPTGIVTVEIASAANDAQASRSPTVCPSCAARGHARDARFCRLCAADLSVK